MLVYLKEGDLATHIKGCKEKGQQFPEELILNWFIQILLALRYIHRFNVIHRDLKASNIFLSSDGSLKIGDFGIAKILEEKFESAQTVVGTPYYMSPEIFMGNQYSSKADVWSIGCILYELCTLEHIFKVTNLVQLLECIKSKTPNPIPKIYSLDLQKLVTYILQKDQTKRPSIDEILSTKFIGSCLLLFTSNTNEVNGDSFIHSIAQKRTLAQKKSSENLDSNNINIEQASPEQYKHLNKVQNASIVENKVKNSKYIIKNNSNINKVLKTKSKPELNQSSDVSLKLSNVNLNKFKSCKEDYLMMDSKVHKNETSNFCNLSEAAPKKLNSNLLPNATSNSTIQQVVPSPGVFYSNNLKREQAKSDKSSIQDIYKRDQYKPDYASKVHILNSLVENESKLAITPTKIDESFSIKTEFSTTEKKSIKSNKAFFDDKYEEEFPSDFEDVTFNETPTKIKNSGYQKNPVEQQRDHLKFSGDQINRMRKKLKSKINAALFSQIYTFVLKNSSKHLSSSEVF